MQISLNAVAAIARGLPAGGKWIIQQADFSRSLEFSMSLAISFPPIPRAWRDFPVNSAVELREGRDP